MNKKAILLQNQYRMQLELQKQLAASAEMSPDEGKSTKHAR